MDYSVEKSNDNYITVLAEGRLDAFTGRQLWDELDGLCNQGYRNFIADLSETTFMDSAGLAVLVRLLKRTKNIDGTTVLVWPKQETASRILRLTRFDRIFTIQDSVEDAIQSLK
ncbi:MAG: STAS domain-containing protein [Chloroflexota bacterium]